ncbi:MAG: hypothetical protein EAZ57_02470 [Cytophagales bacterium]|nr:MAG: hypothetical protein EAZ67_02930 [Cytophagales bacterium]TAF61629.1 MAG: hypothetical protein EAZ57_02470 [Cytophagales bacterium]
MKTFILSTIATLFLFAQTTFAQSDFAFSVIASKGNSTVGNTALKNGSKISSDQTINIPAGAYLGLSHKNGKTLELKAPGSFRVSELEKQVKATGTSSLTSKYASYVASEITASNGNGESRLGKMTKTGAVKRDLKKPIMVFTDASAKMASLLGNQLVITWAFDEMIAGGVKESEIAGYELIVSDLFGKEIFRTDVTGNSYTLDLTNTVKAAQFTYSVRAKNRPESIMSDATPIKRITGNQAQEYNKDLAAFGDDNSALIQVIRANYFEEKGLILDAKASYENAIKAAPDVDDFKTLYKEFLSRNHMTKETYVKSFE